MQLYCPFCQHTFSSAFGPPHARCPSCQGTDLQHADANTPIALPQASQYAGFGFDSPELALERAPQSVPSHVLNTLPWLVASIVLAIFCQPVALAGLYFSDQAKTLARHGKLPEAREKLLYAQISVIGGWGLVAAIIFVIIVLAALGEL